MTNLETVIGLEIHIKINSENKLFCRCKNTQEFENLEPNSNICPICTGQPGALPALNREPLEKSVALGLALGCHIQQVSRFDRKSYFYPDLPMGYQITQQLQPTNIDGEVPFFVDKGFKESRIVRIRDAHIETDTGKSLREDGKVFLDYNRAATPLVEIVTHPDFRETDEVIAFLKELQRLARFNAIGDADMEKGQMRVDVNISLRPVGSDWFGTRVELKNMNSYSAIQRAIAHEVERQKTLMEEGNEVDQQTRMRDDSAKESVCMRSKEDAMDYRYMPEPDMPIIHLSLDEIDTIRADVVESPYSRISRYAKDYDFNKEYINALINDVALNTLFEHTIAEGYEAKESAKWLVGPISRWLNENHKDASQLPFSFGYVVTFLEAIKKQTITGTQAKAVMKEMLDSGKDPLKIIANHGFKPVSDNDIQGWIEELFNEKPELRTDIEQGNMKPMGFIIGHVMKKSGGSANPGVVQKVLKSFVK